MSGHTPRTQTRRLSSRVAAAVAAVVIGVLAAVATSAPVSAHTGFESSTPSDGGSIDEAVDVVTIVFTGEATPVGDEFVALTPDGVIQEAASIETTDDKTFSVRFDPPLTGGQIGIRWNVQAADAHPIEGAFAFTVNAAPAASSTTTTQAPVASTEPDATQTSVSAVETSDDDSVAVIEPSDDSTAAAESPSQPIADEAPAQSLDEFLAVDDSTPGETTATIGRLVGLLGVTIGIGALAFVGSALRGRRDEIRHALTGVRVLGALVVIGAAVEYVGVARIGGQSLTGGWSTAPGFATVLRLAGGIGLALGIAGTISRGRVQRVMRRPSVVRSLSAAVIDDVATQPTRVGIDDPIVRWTPDIRSWPALVGAVLIVASFWFDGHTVSKGFRPLHALVNTVHVLAGAIWVGGVVTMAAVIWSRYRSDQPMRVVELVVRFSKIATLALAAVVAAGAIMAFLVLDTFGELTGTQWGKMLLLKTAAVGLAMLGGAYNHFRLLPALEADPESPELLEQLRSTVTAEAIMLFFVVTVTAWLVAAAS